MGRSAWLVLVVNAALIFCMGFSPADSSPPKPPAIFGGDVIIELGTEWRLPEVNFVRAKMPMTLVHPRPDNETNVWARHRRAYPGLKYRIPISVQGGAYPFRFEILAAPEWLSIGERYHDENYGVLHGTAPTNIVASEPVSIRVYGQEYGREHEVTVGPLFVDVKFSLAVTKEGFVFVDASVESAGDGTIESPLKRFGDLHGDAYPGNGALANAGTSAFAGKIAYFRAGTYWTADIPTPWLPWSSSQRPYTLLGYPGETAEIVFENAKIGNNSNGHLGGDFFVGELRLRKTQDMHLLPATSFGSSWLNGDGWTTGNSSRMFWITNTSARFTMFELHVSEQGEWIHPGTKHGGNSGVVHASALEAETFRDYFTAWDIQGQHMHETLIGSIYSTRYGVVERLRVLPNSEGGIETLPHVALIHLKQNGVAWSIRRNEWTGFPRSNSLNGALYASATVRSGNMQFPATIELCYNLLHSVGNQNGYVINYLQTGLARDKFPPGINVWIYRNTLIGGFYRQDGPITVTFENNVAMLRNGSYDDAHSPQIDFNHLKQLIGPVDLLGDSSDWKQFLDDEYQLKGDYRNKYLGVVGHEISGRQ